MDEWFDKPDDAGVPGLRFACTLCGNCCSGPEGYVLVSDEEVSALAHRLGVTFAEFIRAYTHETSRGRSLTEKPSPGGLDCVFLDREKVPGKAVCGVYEDRPAQCRTWPFWRSNLGSRWSWKRAAAMCPGMNSGPRFTPLQIRGARARVDI